MFRVYTGDRGFGQLHGNVAVRRRTTQGHKFSSAFIISTGYSVKGDRIRAAMQIAARPVFREEKMEFDATISFIV